MQVDVLLNNCKQNITSLSFLSGTTVCIPYIFVLKWRNIASILVCFNVQQIINISHYGKCSKNSKRYRDNTPKGCSGSTAMDDGLYRLRAKKGPAPPPPPPLGNFADLSYLEENFKPHLLRDVCTLCSGALVSDSLLHMLL